MRSVENKACYVQQILFVLLTNRRQSDIIPTINMAMNGSLIKKWVLKYLCAKLPAEGQWIFLDVCSDREDLC